jgi:FkbM family methyltransferase
MYKEIFERQIYKFSTKSKTPYIIDCGANIGLSILYFKKLFPFSRIVAFEPDIKIFDALVSNINSFGLKDVTIENKAVWNADSKIEFMSEGADGGRIVEVESCKQVYNIPTIRLRNYLNEKVDLLKLDIEGSEFEVLKDCKDLLNNVENLFVEYHSFQKQEQSLSTILYLLYNAGFRIYIDQVRSVRQPFLYRNTYLGMDMILNIFAFRE